jgi:hypothetical protein
MPVTISFLIETPPRALTAIECDDYYNLLSEINADDQTGTIHYVLLK